MARRVLMLNYEYPPLGGGAGNATAYLLREFAKRPEWEIDLVTSSTGAARGEQLAPNIRIHYLDIGKRGNQHYQSHRDLLRYSWQAWRYCRRLIRQRQFDLVHAWFGIPGGVIARRLGLPYLVSLRGSDVPFYNPRFARLDRLIFQRLSRRVWARACVVIANSSDLRALARRTSPQLEIPVIPNGVDTRQFSPAAEPPAHFTVISTSRLIERKGIRDLIAGFAAFAGEHPLARLLLVGSGDLEADLHAKVQALGISSQVEFIGAVDHAALPDLYRRADAFVLPSLNEGMSNSLLEAMASGLAIIATRTGGAAELVPSAGGSLIEPGQPEQIRAALAALADDRSRLAAAKVAVRKKAEQLAWAQIADEVASLYTARCLPTV
jgi:glycosyltransferase involved in cell wall biosynthesis